LDRTFLKLLIGKVNPGVLFNLSVLILLSGENCPDTGQNGTVSLKKAGHKPEIGSPRKRYS
jgi:hypothetical protein